MIPIIEHEALTPDFDKFHIKGLPFDAVIHHIKAPDFGLAHDHPFAFTSHILKGWYIEEHYWLDGNEKHIIKRQDGDVVHLPATWIHRIIEISPGGCWTIIIPQKCERKWGHWDFPLIGKPIFYEHPNQ